MSYLDELRTVINTLQHIVNHNSDGDGFYEKDGAHVGELAVDLYAKISQWVTEHGTPIQIARLAEGTNGKLGIQSHRQINFLIEADDSQKESPKAPPDAVPPAPPKEEKPSQ